MAIAIILFDIKDLGFFFSENLYNAINFHVRS